MYMYLKSNIIKKKAFNAFISFASVHHRKTLFWNKPNLPHDMRARIPGLTRTTSRTTLRMLHMKTTSPSPHRRNHCQTRETIRLMRPRDKQLSRNKRQGRDRPQRKD